jgi:deoxyuridine 5'-triphosphate nucleotidohydrolase
MAVWRNLTFGTAHASGISQSTTYGTMYNEDIMLDWEDPVLRIRVKKLHPDAILPKKAHSGDLGYDLFTLGSYEVKPNKVVLVSTGICIEFPQGYGGIIRDRSSVATVDNLFVVAGVIDNGYTGEIKIALYNASGETKYINDNYKIAQLVLIPTTNFQVQEVSEIRTNDGRGHNGFGSTGE